MVMMNYIVNFLATTPTIDNMIGGDTVKGMLGFGRYVIALFAVIFLFYTNSFLMRRRKKEFGLYNGQEKHRLPPVLRDSDNRSHISDRRPCRRHAVF